MHGHVDVMRLAIAAETYDVDLIMQTPLVHDQPAAAGPRHSSGDLEEVALSPAAHTGKITKSGRSAKRNSPEEPGALSPLP
jgi:hypothetical protein